MLTRLAIKNFKSIGENGVELTLKPLTILVGPNGSGKSSILEAIATLGQSAEGHQFATKGRLVSYELVEVAHKSDLAKRMSFEIEDEDGVGLVHGFRPDIGELKEAFSKQGSLVLTVRSEGDRRTGLRLVIEDAEGMRSPPARLDLPPFLNEGYYRASLPEAEDATRLVGVLSRQLENRVFMVSAMRGDVPRETPSAPPDPQGAGARGEKLVPLLAYLGSPHYQHQMQKIGWWSEKFGLPSLWAGLSPTGKLEARYRDPELGHSVNLALAGHGSRQIVAVIAQLFWSMPESIILIEEPELSLHPEAQLHLCELFADAIAEKKQIIVTTHTSTLLLSLSHAVSQGQLKADDVAAYDVNKTEKGTTAKRLNITKDGYVKGWVPSFIEAEKQLFARWREGLPKE